MKYLMIILLLLVAHLAQSQSAQLTVISNQKGAPAALKLEELKSIFMGERQRWRNGTKVIIALMKPNTETGKVISNKLYNMSSDEVNKFWLALVFQGKADSPVSFDSPDALKNFVATNPGAIGIVEQNEVPADAQVTLVDGKKAF
jgi:ABC-type phosphate transport system substrate-binding protein